MECASLLKQPAFILMTAAERTQRKWPSTVEEMRAFIIQAQLR